MKFIYVFLVFSTFSIAQTNFEKGEKLFNEKKYTQAKPLLEAYLKTNPNHLKTLEYLGDIAGNSKLWDNAITYYKKLKELSAKNANYWYKYGGAMGMKAKSVNKLKAVGMIDDIEAAFLTSAKLDAKHTDVRWALLILYLELPGLLGGSETKAQSYANELMKISAIDGHMANGHIDEYYKRYKEAEVHYLKGVKLTHSKTAYQRLINLYTKMKLPEKVKAAQEESKKYNK
jgi:tetratricopeptide (TPR) repeat protein